MASSSGVIFQMEPLDIQVDLFYKSGICSHLFHIKDPVSKSKDNVALFWLLRQSQDVKLTKACISSCSAASNF